MRKYDRHKADRYSLSVDDYEDELRAFSRKREWEREREKHKKTPSLSPSSSEDEKSNSQPKKKRHNKLRGKRKSVLPYDSEGTYNTYIYPVSR